MSTIDTTYLGKQVSFTLWPSAIMGDSYTNVKLLAILDYQSASQITDVASLHANVFPTIPLPYQPANDYTSYSYLKIQFPNLQVGVIGIPWIIHTGSDSGVTVLTNNTIVATIYGVGPSDVAAIRELLSANNYNTATLSLQ